MQYICIQMLDKCLHFIIVTFPRIPFYWFQWASSLKELMKYSNPIVIEYQSILLVLQIKSTAIYNSNYCKQIIENVMEIVIQK